MSAPSQAAATKPRRRPIIMGIVGDSAAGKTTLTTGIARILGPERVTQVCADDYHKYDRTERAALGITPLHHDCNYLDVMELHFERMHYAQPILKPVYDHSNGSLVRPEYLVAKQFVIIEGLHTFATPILRQYLDILVYLDPPEDVRRVWKVGRDTSKRGYTEAQVLAEMERREEDSARFIRPQREFADIVVRFQPVYGDSPESRDCRYDVRMVLRPTIEHPDLGYLLEGAASHDDTIRLELGRDQGRPADFLHIVNDVSPSQAAALEDAIWSHMPYLRPISADKMGEYQDHAVTRHSDHLALTQLLLASYLLRLKESADEPVTVPPVAVQIRVPG